MYSIFRNRFGIPGIISVVALVFAMLGGAYAASNSNSRPSAIASAKAKKGPRGPKGKTGATGPQGAAGANGKDGANGTSGKDGSNGADGKSVVAGSEAKGVNCAAGGSNFEVEGSGVKHYACNGSFSTEPLPKGQTLTGAWGVSGVSADKSLAQISFPIAVVPTAIGILQFAPGSEFGVELKNGTFEQVQEEEFEEDCPGSASDPSAKGGFLCIYQASVTGTSGTDLASSQFELVHQYGVLVPLQVSGVAGESQFVKGSWAVTAP